MLTVLEIKKEEPKSLADRVMSVVKPYSIETEIKKTKNIEVANVKYTFRRGEIRFDKILNHCMGKSKTVLCSESVSLKNTPFRRFCGLEYKKIMMQNFLTDVLSKLYNESYDMNIVYFDSTAENPLFVQQLLKFTSNLTVISDMPRFYENEMERVADDCGASVTVSNDIDAAGNFDILISPTVIDREIAAPSGSIVFTVSVPKAPVSGICITDYHVHFPAEYQSILPEEIDEDIFLAALYSLCGITSLADEIPFSCSNSYSIFTEQAMIRKFSSFSLR